MNNLMLNIHFKRLWKQSSVKDAKKKKTIIVMALKSKQGKAETKFSCVDEVLQLLMQQKLKSISKCEFEGEKKMRIAK